MTITTASRYSGDDNAMFEAIDTLANYWEQRAVRFARQDDGLAAVCSYGMPRFYNRMIEICQRRALHPWLTRVEDRDVLEIGCGVGRWTRLLAGNGNRVTAIDLSPTMIDEAGTRLRKSGLDADLHVADVTTFNAGRRFDCVLSVTVIQHVTDEQGFTRVFDNLADHLKPGGRAILLEAAPTDRVARCDSPIFRARPEDAYTSALQASGFRIDEICGVDPMPFKTWALPYLRRLPRPAAIGLTAIVTALSLPLDLLLARWLTPHSWHKLIIATRME